MYKKLVWASYVFYLFTVIAFADRIEFYMFSNLSFVVMIVLMGGYILPRGLNMPQRLLVFLPFVFYSFLSYIWSYEKDATWERSTTLIKLLIFFIVFAWYILKTGEIREYVVGIAISGIAVFFYVLATYGIIGLQNLYNEGTRVGGEIVNENTLAIYLSFAFLIILCQFLEHKKWLYLIICIALGVLIALTGSKKGLIDIVLGTALLFLLLPKDKNSLKKTIKIMLWIIGGALILYYLWQQPVFDIMRARFEMMFDFLSGTSGVIDYSTRERQRMIEYGLEQFFKTPILGIGIGASGYITQSNMEMDTYLHNNYVELLATGGIVGTLLYYIPVIKLVLDTWKLRKKSSTHMMIFVLTVLLCANDFASVGYFSKINTAVYAIALATVMLDNRGATS